MAPCLMLNCPCVNFALILLYYLVYLIIKPIFPYKNASAIWRTTFALWRATFALWRMTIALWRTTSALWSTTSALWSTTSALWSMTFALWRTTCALWRITCAPWLKILILIPETSILLPLNICIFIGRKINLLNLWFHKAENYSSLGIIIEKEFFKFKEII